MGMLCALLKDHRVISIATSLFVVFQICTNGWIRYYSLIPRLCEISQFSHTGARERGWIRCIKGYIFSHINIMCVCVCVCVCVCTARHINSDDYYAALLANYTQSITIHSVLIVIIRT